MESAPLTNNKRNSYAYCKKLLSLTIIFSTTACLSLEGIEVAGTKAQPGKLTKFYCENGYKGSVKLRDNGVASLAYSDGKNSYITYVNKMASSNEYVNDKKTLRWQNNMGKVVFSYPDQNYASTKQLATTHCQVR
ncbi:hypothetical protein GVX76_01170 [[Haemophilus] felis]|nr:hypothetical protein [[Haemophilus] felis]